jgi:hypothetical protein
MIATPARASVSAARVTLSVETEPSAKAWLTATLPWRPVASARRAISRICVRPASPLRGAGRAQDAALREGHDLDRDEVAEMIADLQDFVEVAKSELVVDVDMSAHVQGAAGHHLAHQVRAGLEFEHRARRAHPALGLDAVRDRVAGRLVGNPRQAEQRLVEMDMAVDQRRQDQRSAQIDAVLRRRRNREEGGDPPSLDFDIVPAAVGQRGIEEAHASVRLTWRPSGRLPCA